MAKVKLFEGIVIPTGIPGKLPCGTSYRQKIRMGLRKKFGEENAERKEWWHLKHTGARWRKAQILWDRQNGQCIFCNNSTSLEKRKTGSGRNMATLDHILPQSMGGTDHLSNMIIACKACNSARGTMDFFEFANLRWSKSEKTFQAAIRNRKNKDRNLKRDAKKKEKQALTIWSLGVLFYLQPEWASKANEVIEEHRRYLEARKERQKIKRIARSLSEVPAGIHEVPHASLSALPFQPSGSHGPEVLVSLPSFPAGHCQP